MVQKIVINDCFGGFSLSFHAIHLLRELGNTYAMEHVAEGEPYYGLWNGEPQDGITKHVATLDMECIEIPRNDPDLITIIEQYGTKTISGALAQLRIIEIPDDVEWQIEEYDGNEWVAEKHRTWGYED